MTPGCEIFLFIFLSHAIFSVPSASSYLWTQLLKEVGGIQANMSVRQILLLILEMSSTDISFIWAYGGRGGRGEYEKRDRSGMSPHSATESSSQGLSPPTRSLDR